MKSSHFLQLFMAWSLFLLAPVARGEATYVVDQTVITNYPASGPMMIIHADQAVAGPPPGSAPYDRWFIAAQANITITATAATSVVMQATFRLVDSTGHIVPCAGADANGYVASAGQLNVFPNAGIFGAARSAYLIPLSTVKIDPTLFYRLETRLSSTGRGGSLLDTAESGYIYRFIQFTGPNASDAAVNVTGYLGTGSLYTKTYALKTQTANADFTLSVPWALYRYDDPDALSQTSSVNTHFLVELFDSAAPGVPIPLKSPVTDVTLSMPNHAILGFIIPSVLSGTQTLKFQPAAGIQLNSPGKTYFAKVSLSHDEVLPAQTALPDCSRSLSAVRLLAFNGRLIFGQSTANPINTTVLGITNNPTTGALVTGTAVDTSLVIAAASVDGTGHTLTSPGVNVSLVANGDALIRGASSVILTAPAFPDRDSVAGVRFDRAPITLNAAGAATGTLSTILPAGMGWATSAGSKVMNGRFLYSNVLLNQQLEPVIPSQVWLPAGGTGWVMEESKPTLIGASQVVWVIAAGRFDITVPDTTPVRNAVYVRGPELAELAAAPVAAALKTKRSNEQYWRWAENVSTACAIRAGVLGGAEFTGSYAFTNTTSTGFRTHFPYDAAMTPASGHCDIADDLIQSSTSTLTLRAASPIISMRWLNGCLDPYCDPAAPPVTLQSFSPANGILRLTGDGGLVADGAFTTGLNLRWGFIPATPTVPAAFAHQVETPFTQGTFVMGGIFLKGSSSSTGKANDGPGIIMLTGVATTGAPLDRPTTNNYSTGRGEYPGFNVDLGADDATASGIHGVSTLAGKSYGPYALKHRCKYYVRRSGVTGIHDKVAGPAETIVMYGYKFTLTNFGLSFLDNGVHDSRVNGRVVVPYPADIFVDFEELSFLCNGGLNKAKIASTMKRETMAYWLAPIDVKAMQFVHPDKCSTDEGYLILGLVSSSSHINVPLSGTVGFLSNGNLMNKNFSDTKMGELDGLDSRFKVPKLVKFQGPSLQKELPELPAYEEYAFTPVVDAYLNMKGTPGQNWNHKKSDNVDGEQGFWNLGGRLKVSYFESPEIHFQTTANEIPAPADQLKPSPWQNSIINLANGAWKTDVSSSSYFSTAVYHDTWNRGLPYPASVGGTGQSLKEYSTLPAYMPVTRQKWLGGAIKFEYKLIWNSSTRSFTSMEASESQADANLAQQMVILKIDHRLPYLSAKRAELTFGATYSGMPKINLANMVLNEIDDATGVLKAATQAGCKPIFKSLDDGLNSLAKMLNDQLKEYFTEALSPLVDGVTNSLYSNLAGAWNSNPTQPQWDAQVDILLNAKFGPQQELRSGLQNALQKANQVGSQIDRIKTLLNKTHDALNVLDSFFSTNDPDGDNPAHEIRLARNLAKQLIIVLSNEIGGTLGSIVGSAGIDKQIGDLIDPLIKDAQPTLLDLKAVLSQLTGIIQHVQDALDETGDFGKEMIAIVNAGQGELDTLSSGVKTEMTQFLKSFHPGVAGGKNFTAFSATEIKLKITNAIYDRFFGTTLLTKIQVALKQRLQDVEVAIRSGLDSVFAEVNKLVKKTISGLLSEVDDTINGVIGSFADYLGSGSVQGYATFNGDALRKLRLDGRFEFKVPTAVHIEAFLEINQYTSKDTPPGCATVNDGESLTEVIMGAKNVPTDFLSPGVKMNLDAKFSFKTVGGVINPEGMGGGIAMAQGPIDFEAFKITKLAVGIAFGHEENYFSAGLGMEMSGYGANGGVFFGRTCTLDPILLWDSFAAKALGVPHNSFTGIYVYGEIHIPVSEVLLGIPATCFFEISADAGVGFFVFAEGPTFGARMALGVEGHVACILGISGRVDLLGGKFGGQTKLTGKGEFCASILGIEACKDVTISTSVGSDGSMKGNGDAK
jgi:hypothetical protein